MMTVNEAAERHSVSDKTVLNLLKTGRIGHNRIGAGRGIIRISEEALDRHLADCEVQEHHAVPPSRRSERKMLRKTTLESPGDGEGLEWVDVASPALLMLNDEFLQQLAISPVRLSGTVLVDELQEVIRDRCRRTSRIQCQMGATGLPRA